jgi:hypothetical protein
MAIANITNNILTDSGVATSSLLPLTGGTLTGGLIGQNATFDGNLRVGTLIGSLEVGYASAIGLYKLDVNGTGRFTYTGGVPALNIRASDANFALMSILGNQTGDVNWLLMSGYPVAGDFTIRQSDTVNALTLKKTTGAATFSAKVSVKGGTNAGGYYMDYQSDATSRSFRVSSEHLVFGDFVIQRSTTQTGTTYEDLLYFDANRAATFSSSVTAASYLGVLKDGSDTIGAGAYLVLAATTSSRQWIQQLSASQNLTFYHYTGSAWIQPVTFTSGGNVLIGTTTATSQKLTVNSATAAGQVRITGAAPTVYFTDTVTDPANYVGLVGLATATNNFFTGTAAGDFVMYNQVNGYKLFVVNYSGGVYLTSGATSWTANSDIRLKNINSHIENAVEKLSTLQTINFSYKDDKFKKQNLGLIAQEVEKIFPELIDKNNDGMLGVRYTELVPVLIKAIQELKLEIETLKIK